MEPNTNDVVTTEEYWDCECLSGDYIHPKSMPRCPKCGAERDYQPDSRKEEVEEYLLRLDMVNTLSALLEAHDRENIRRFEAGREDLLEETPEIVSAREILKKVTGKYPLPDYPFLAEEYPQYWSEEEDTEDTETCPNCKRYPPKCAGCKFKDGDYLTPTERKILDVGRIWHNRARCKKCGEIIESKHRHDFVMCKCGAVGIDGGTWYIRCTGMPDDMELLTELYDPEPSE